MNQKFVGVWTFRVLTIAAPALTVLGDQLQRHSFDPWLMGSAAVGSVVVAILHAGRANVESQVQTVVTNRPPGPTTGGTS